MKYEITKKNLVGVYGTPKATYCWLLLALFILVGSVAAQEMPLTQARTNFVADYIPRRLNLLAQFRVVASA